MDTSAADSVSVSGSSISVGDTNKRIWSRDEIRQIIASGQFEKFEEELDEAMSEGRIR
jgi:predicted oxidoreductase (fatty acid repression mutant protein)